MGEDWIQQAACRGIDVQTFYPGQWNVAAYKLAQSYCFGCPAQLRCLREGMKSHEEEDFGIWGGTGARWRNRFRKMIKKAFVCHNCRAPFVATQEADPKSVVYCSAQCSMIGQAAQVTFSDSQTSYMGATPQFGNSIKSFAGHKATEISLVAAPDLGKSEDDRPAADSSAHKPNHALGAGPMDSASGGGGDNASTIRRRGPKPKKV